MGRWNYREVEKPSEYQKWDYITLSDFRSTSVWTAFTYGYLWFLAIIAVAVYVSDTYTAITLLAYNHWSSQIQPTVPYHISKWVFAGTILFSWLLLIYEWIRAIKVIRGGNVADNYLDPLAATVQSLRVNTGGQGWRRFLVFKALTKSKKGADYVALFNYFQFKAAVRVVVAEGPRQVINALTLQSVMNATLYPKGVHGIDSMWDHFWENVEVLAVHHRIQASIIFTMSFSLVIWAFSALSLIVACIAHVAFLWHYVPASDGSLSNYCRRKIDRRLGRIVNEKAKMAIERIENKRKKEELRAEKSGKPLPERPLEVTATLPDVPRSPSTAPGSEYHMSRKPSVASTQLSRSTSNSSTLPPYSTGAGMSGPSGLELARRPTLPTIGENYPRPEPPSRTATQSSEVSKASYGSDDVLLNQSAQMGEDSLAFPESVNPQPLTEELKFPSNPSEPPPNTSPGPNAPFEPPPRSMTAPVALQRSFSRPFRPPTSQSIGHAPPPQARNAPPQVSSNSNIPPRRPVPTQNPPQPVFAPPPTKPFGPPQYPAAEYAPSTRERGHLPQPSYPPPPSQRPPPAARPPQPQQNPYHPYSPYTQSTPRFPPPPPRPRPGHTRDPSTGNEVPIIRNPMPPPRRVMTNPNDGGRVRWEQNFVPQRQNAIPPPHRLGSAPPGPVPEGNPHWW